MGASRSRSDLTSRRGQVAVAALGAVLTLAAAGVVHQPRGLYWSDTQVYFLAPVADRDSNTYAYTTSSVIATAGLVGRMVQPDASGAGTGAQTTLLASGAHHGTEVRLPNSGGQWDLNFDKPLLDVQVVGTSPDEVTRVTTRVLDRIRTEADRVQTGVVPRSQMELLQEPAEVQVHYSQGEPRRAVAGALLAGGLLTTLFTRRVGRRRVRPARGGPTGARPADCVTTPSSAASHPLSTDVRRREPAGV